MLALCLLALLFVLALGWPRPGQMPHHRGVRTHRAAPPFRGRVHWLTFAEGYRFQTEAEEQRQRYRDEWGVVDRCHIGSLRDVDPAFRERNRAIFDQKRGFGYWLWKPHMVERLLREELEDGDLLWYCDAGRIWTRSPTPLLERVHQSRSGILLFKQRESQGRQTKGDVFAAAGVPEEALQDAYALPQLFAGSFFVQKRPSSLAVVQEWLRLAQLPGLIDDSPSVGAPDPPTFRSGSYRHDQAILSVLAWRAGVDTLDKEDEEFYVRRRLPAGYLLRKWRLLFRLALKGGWQKLMKPLRR